MVRMSLAILRHHAVDLALDLLVLLAARLAALLALAQLAGSRGR